MHLILTLLPSKYVTQSTIHFYGSAHVTAAKVIREVLFKVKRTLPKDKGKPMQLSNQGWMISV
jgi:hypothetical protein